MTRSIVVTGLCVVALAGCGHARSVEDPAAAAEQNPGKAKAGKAPNDTPPSDRQRARAARSETKEKPSSPSEIPVTMSPAGQLSDGAVKKIQDRLVAKDFLDADQKSGELDERTSEGLRKFQKSRDLAATGTPDEETVRKLGLDPDQIFRAAH